MKILDVQKFLELAFPILDARSPSEYKHAHIPYALSLPLFSDAERAKIGTTYKQQGSQIAILEGLDLVGPKLKALVLEANRLTRETRKVRMHCWRGGMRSSSLAWLLETTGYEVYLLKGGYKAFRNEILSSFQQTKNVILLSGMTGSGKTEILQALKQLGETAIDLEGLARHRGSSFGSLGMGEQPGTQQFENDLGMEWRKIPRDRRVWIESESRTIGKVVLPKAVFTRMKSSFRIEIQRPLESRLEILTRMYSNEDPQELEEAVLRLQKRLGGIRTKEALEYLHNGNYSLCAQTLLTYYDTTYARSLQQFTGPSAQIYLPDSDPLKSAQALIDFLESTNQS